MQKQREQGQRRVSWRSGRSPLFNTCPIIPGGASQPDHHCSPAQWVFQRHCIHHFSIPIANTKDQYQKKEGWLLLFLLCLFLKVLKVHDQLSSLFGPEATQHITMEVCGQQNCSSFGQDAKEKREAATPSRAYMQ